MTISIQLAEFEGLSVVEYAPDAPIATASTTALRLSIPWDRAEGGESFVDLLARFLADPQSAEAVALIIGDWGEAGGGNDSAPVIEALVSAREKLPKLRGIFLGEMIVEECEISWITQSDVAPLFDAFPNLETLYIRGGNELRLGRPQHERLRKLVIETGGLPSEVVQDVASATLPNLEHLELWLGDDSYGNDIGLGDIRQLLTAGPCSKLTYLGLRDDCNADETAKLLAEVGVPENLKVLDLSLGALGDEGAAAIAACSWLKQIEKLDIHFHYVSPELVQQLRASVRELDANDVQEPDEWDGELHRYVAVGE